MRVQSIPEDVIFLTTALPLIARFLTVTRSRIFLRRKIVIQRITERKRPIPQEKAFQPDLRKSVETFMSEEDVLTVGLLAFGTETLPHSATTKAAAITVIMAFVIGEGLSWKWLVNPILKKYCFGPKKHDSWRVFARCNRCRTRSQHADSPTDVTYNLGDEVPI